MTTKQRTLDAIKEARNAWETIFADNSALENLNGTQIEAFDKIDAILRGEQFKLETPQPIDEQQPISPVYSKLNSKKTSELVELAQEKRAELEPENTGVLLQALLAEYHKAQEAKYRFKMLHNAVLTEKTKVIDKNERETRWALYGAFADAIETGEIKLDERRQNEHGEDLDSYVMPNWLPDGLDVQNAVELVYDEKEVELWARMLNIWDVMSVDPVKLERFLKRDTDNREGKRTIKFASPIPCPALILQKFKPTLGKAAQWQPESEDGGDND